MVIDQIEGEVSIAASPEVVWEVLTDPAQISEWFSDSAEIDLRPGGEGTLAWNHRSPVQLRVETVQRPHRFSFRWIHPEGVEPHPGNSMLVEFTLEPEGEGTRLRVVERGLPEIDWTEDEKARYADEHNRGWSRHLGRLVRYASRQTQAS